jgi:hypothetical protein
MSRAAVRTIRIGLKSEESDCNQYHFSEIRHFNFQRNLRIDSSNNLKRGSRVTYSCVTSRVFSRYVMFFSLVADGAILFSNRTIIDESFSCFERLAAPN